MFSKLLGVVSADLAIDLGTANTRVWGRGRGLVLDEPSVVAIQRGTTRVLSRGRVAGAVVGRLAKPMVGRAPHSIDAVRPLEEGTIVDFEVAEAMLAHFIREAAGARRWIGPRVLIAAKLGLQPVSKRIVFDAAERAGARRVYLIEAPRAAGLGAGLPIHEARAHMVLDVGAGTTDVAVLSLGDIVISESVKVAGDAMDRAIVEHLKKHYGVLVGDTTAEDVKIRLGSACPAGEESSVVVPGRDLIAGLPRSVTVTSEEVREAIAEPVRQILLAIRRTLERTGPDLSGDLLERGILACGGGVRLQGLAEAIAEDTGLPVRVAEEPETTVVRGAGMLLDRLDESAQILESAEDEN